MTSPAFPSVASMVTAEHLFMLKLPGLQAQVSRFDEVLKSYLQAGAAQVDLTLAEAYGQAGGPSPSDAQMLLNIFRPDFAELMAEQPGGELLRGSAFARALSLAARAFAAKKPLPDDRVFVRVNLALLHGAAG
jgi:hypothetical protein